MPLKRYCEWCVVCVVQAAWCEVRVVRAMRFTHTPLHCKVTGVEKRSTSSSSHYLQQQQQLQPQRQLQQQQQQAGRQQTGWKIMRYRNAKSLFAE